MRLLVLLLALPLFSSCALLKTPARTLQAVGRTFGLAHQEANQTPPAAQVALELTK